jgi:hypothetical protein
MDYFIRVSDGYIIYNSPRHEGWAEMSHSVEGLVVENVRAYGTVVGGIVTGRSNDGYFVALPDGIVSFFDSESSWGSGCRELAGSDPPKLKEPSRMDYPLWWKFQVVAIVMAACWLALFTKVVLGGRRTRMSASERAL